jgi:CDP-diacylglycerol--glycerol-3-phosphate 3-phosphatidyltransferase
MQNLKKQWLFVAGLFSAAILMGYGLLRGQAYGGANQWLGQTAVLAAYCLWIVWRYLPENHRKDDPSVLPKFGWGNRLTIMRGLLMSMMAGFLFLPWPSGWLGWVPAMLYFSADVADFMDGYAARKTNHATLLGARLDMEFDGLGILAVTLLAVWFGQLPWWYLLIGLARYFFIFGLWLRKRRNMPIHDMPHSWHRRIFAGFQMSFMSVVLWPIIPAWGATIAGTLFALATSASFLRDWFIVIGWLETNSVTYQSRQHQIYRLFSFYIPPVLRLLFALGVVILIRQIDTLWQPAGWVTLFTGWHLPFPAVVASFLALLGFIAIVMITVGAMGRIMAWLILFPLGFDMIVTGPTPINTIAMSCVIMIMMLGTGAFSLWQPEEPFMYRRAGE